MKRVLLTGATGFVGRHAIAPLLERGFEVHAVSRSGAPAADTGAGGGRGVHWHAADLLDAQATDVLVREVRASHLLHLAWYGEHGKFWEAPENSDWVAGGVRLLSGFREAGGERAVAAGTCAEYDWSGDCCGPLTALAPATLYGASKNALREIVEAYAAATALSAAWGRVFFTFGPGEQPTRVIAAVARALVAGNPVACSSGSQVRDFLYVEDLAAAFAALLDSDAQGAFDIGSGEGVALKDLLVRLEQLSGHRGLVRFGALPSRNEPARIVADSRRLASEIGWTPRYDLDEALRRTLTWWSQADPPGAPTPGDLRR